MAASTSNNSIDVSEMHASFRQPFYRRHVIISSRRHKMIAEALNAEQLQLHARAAELIFKANNAGRMQNVFDLRDLIKGEATDQLYLAIAKARENQWPAFLVIIGHCTDAESEEHEHYETVRLALVQILTDENIRFAEQPGVILAGFPPFAANCKWPKPRTAGIIEFTRAPVECLLRKCALPVDLYEAELASIYLDDEAQSNWTQKRKVQEEEQRKKAKAYEATKATEIPRWQMRQKLLGEAKGLNRGTSTDGSGKDKKDTSVDGASLWFKLLVLSVIVIIVAMWAKRLVEIL